jgi:hypothetical protein
MIDQASSEYGLLATPDAISGGDSPAGPLQLLPEPRSPTKQARIVFHDAPTGEDQDLLADVRLQALDVHAEVDYRDNHPEIDLGLWYKHACRPYLINFAAKVPSYEVKRITQYAEEHRNWIKDDLLRTGRLLFTLEFDESRLIQEQEQLRIERSGLRRKPREQKSRDDTGSVLSDGSGTSLETTISKSSQTSESAMNDVEQSYAQLLRTLEEVRQKLAPTSIIFGVVDLETRTLETVVRSLEDTLKVHQDNAREIGFSKCD